MEINENDVAYVETVLDDSTIPQETRESSCEDIIETEQIDDTKSQDIYTEGPVVANARNRLTHTRALRTGDLRASQRNSGRYTRAVARSGSRIDGGAVWTTNATLTLLKLYEANLEMLETPKKKTRIWIAISENLKEYNIEMTPDQVRWKINALAKKYKQCIDIGQNGKFKYFKEMDNIYAQYNVDCDSYTIQNSEILHRKMNSRRSQSISANEATSSVRSNPESKAMIELRKLRLASRIEADRSQSKINLEKQWLEYLKRQEEQKKLKDDIHERKLKLREEEIELRKKELHLKQSLELKKLELRKKEQEEMLQIEREKSEILKKIFT